MVSNTSWDDKKIEDLLKRMPLVEDHRKPAEIFYQVQKRMRKEKRQYWYIPAAAIATVLFLSFILYPSIFSNNDASHNDEMERYSVTDNDQGSAMLKANEATDAGNQDVAETEESLEDSTNPGIMELEENPSKSALYTNQVTDDMTAITYAVPDDQVQNIVPVTITVPKNEDQTWVDQYNNNQSQIPFEELGLDGEYLPYKGEVSIASDGSAIKLNLERNHPYNHGSAGNVSLTTSLDYTLQNSPFDKVIFSTEGKPGVEIGNYGVIPEHNVNKIFNQAFFIYQKSQKAKKLLSPYVAISYPTIQEALDAMQEDVDTHNLIAPLKDFGIKAVTEDGEGLIIEFGDQIIDQTQDNMLSLEAILLTAKNFGYKTVIFKHPKQDHFADIMFNEPVEVPMAPNYLEQYSKFER